VRLETEGLRVLPPGKLFLRRIAQAFDHFEGGRR
jgi:hypothetical protein